MGFLILFGAASYYALSRQQAALEDLRENQFVAYRTAAAAESELTDGIRRIRLFTWIGTWTRRRSGRRSARSRRGWRRCRRTEDHCALPG